MDTPSLPQHTHGPYQHQPAETFIAPARRTAMLAQALWGVELGTWDERILAWLAHWCDTPTFLAILGLIQRARHAGSRPQQQGSGGC